MNNDNDFYFETLHQGQGELSEEVLISRIGQCNAVLDELTKTNSWEIVLRDTRDMIRKLDDCWQEIEPSSPKFSEARILKMWAKHLFDLPMKYAQELDMLQEQLRKVQSPNEFIEKDADNEIS